MEATATTLKSRAEVQLLNVLNQKKATSFYLEDEQKTFAEDEEETQQTQARDRISFEALPACSEEAQLISEVRRLEDNFFIVGTNDNQKKEEGFSQIKLNDVRRRHHHMEAQTRYGEEVQAISEDVETAILLAADHVKDVLAIIDAEIQQGTNGLTKNELLLVSDNENILGMWNDLDALCQRRTDEIARFAAQLDDIEQTRIHRVRVGLERLTWGLMKTAHALSPEVERIIEAEVHEVNTVVISNRRVYADLVARMGMANVDVFLNSRLAWEQGQIHWRHLRHDAAIVRFQSTLSSPLFTDPEERQHVLQQIRAFQENIHSKQRLAVLKRLNDAGASLSSDHTKRVMEELSATQQFEEEKNQSFFSDLMKLHKSKGDAAKALREALRLELHGFGAMAIEGSIEESKRTLMALLSDESMEDFFRAAGGLKAELDTLAKQLCVEDLIYNANLEPVVKSVKILLSALPLGNVMEKQGKEAEQKAVQTTLEKIRKATKGEIMSLLPSLQTQISMLINIDDMSDNFKGELSDIMGQLDMIILEYGSFQASDASDPSQLTSTNAVTSSVGASNEKIVSHPLSVAASVSSISMRKSSVMIDKATTSKSKPMDASQSNGKIVDLQAIRKVQRRLGRLVYASELGTPWQQHLRFIADQLLLQTNANRIVDEVISRECDKLIETRQQESRLLVEEMGKRMEQQSALLHDHVEKLVNFFLRVVLCVEESTDKVHYANLSVMDLLDTLKENDENILAGLESRLKQSCARLRHAPNDSILREEFQHSSDLLMLIEEEYRAYDKRLHLAADNNVVAIAKQRLVYLQRLCNFFGLRQLNPSKCDDSFNLEHFLSEKHIEQVLNPAAIETTTINIEDTATAESLAGSSQPELSSPEEEVFQTTSGLKLIVVLSLAALAQDILAPKSEDENGDQEPAHTTITKTSTCTSEQNELHEKELADGGDTTEVEPDSARLLQQAVLEKVQTEFLVLDVPSDTIESMLATFRDGILSKYDFDATTIFTQTEVSRDERHSNSSMFLEERLRVHWPRKGCLDVQFYHPRMGELLNHQQRQDRHLRSVWLKVEDQQTTFAKKVVEALSHVDQTRMTQVGFQAHLPLQVSLAALQGLEVKAKKHLGVFKGEAKEILADLRATTENDINILMVSCQDYIRTCSSQLFPDLTSCDIISGCDYHPEEITSIKAKFTAIEAQAREQISEREKRIIEISNNQGQVLDMWQAFKTRYQTCMQNLAMKEGLGQKFGLPRRAAQERYRSEMTRCESRSAAINTLLSSLQSLVKEEKSDSSLEPSIHEQELTDRVLRMLMQLRAKIYHRGMYFGFLRSPSQLELKPVEFNRIAGHQEGGIREVIRDYDVVDEEDRILAVPFLEFADQVSAKCQEDTKLLYQQGEIDELPPSGVPVALQEYLSNQLEKAHSFVIQQEVVYREQVTLFTHLLTLVPRVVLINFMKQAKLQLRRNISDIASLVETQYQSWMNLKNQHTLELRPHLCSPNNAHLLRELEERERTRSTLTQDALHNLRSQFLSKQIQLSLSFEATLVGLCQCLLLLLDSSVLSLDDLKPFSGEELPKLKRKSLKRLRKVARVNEFGDPQEVRRTTVELQKLTQSGEIPRFPLRSWSGIPSFGLQSLWEEVKSEVTTRDTTCKNSISEVIGKINSIQDLACVPLASNDGACVTLLTPAHRVLIRTRDSVYGDYVTFCREETRRFLDGIHERLNDEVKWMLSWGKGIETMRLQVHLQS